MLLSYQINNLEKLNSMTSKNTNLIIVGKENSGRKYIIEQWSQSKKNPLIINLEKIGLDYEYGSLISVLKKICQIKKNKIIISPNVGFTVSIYTLGISLSVNDDSILKSEKIIKKCLKKLAKKYTLIFVVDDSMHILDKSVELVDEFISQHGKKNTIYKFTLSTKPIGECSCVFFESLTNCNINKYETLKKLNLNPDIKLSNKAVEFIFQNVSDNTKLLVDIVKDINKHNLDSNFEKFDVNNITKTLLNESLKKHKYPFLLAELLTLYAITNYCFQIIDLTFLLNQNEYMINKLIDYCLEYYLVESNSERYQIIFGLVKKIFGDIDEIEKHKKYNNIINMFSCIYPSDYYNKYFFANLAKNSKCGTYLVQHLMQKVRLNYNIDACDFKDILNKNEYLVIESYNCAFGLLSDKKYDECIVKLNKLDELSGALLYEVNILKSQCMIRKIDRFNRERALEILFYKNDNKDIDENLKFRLDIRKIATSVHVGRYKDALKICNDITERLIQMYSKTKSIEYKYYLNVIYRKYSYICEYDLSIEYVKKSVKFFRDNMKTYYKAYYIALNNLFSLYIINMNLKKADIIKQEIENLIIAKNSIKFPRLEISKNNHILYNYFSEKITAKKAMEEFKKLYDETEASADHVFVASNYAVFMMLNHNLNGAKQILSREIDNVKDEQEGTYNYRIITNLSICEFLIDNCKRSECIQCLEKIKYNQEDPHYMVRNKELIGIINLMKNIPKCNDANKWCELYKSGVLTATTFYPTYQQGVIFTTLFDWDDD